MRDRNTIVKLESLGEVHLKFLSLDDMKTINKLLDSKGLTDKDFTKTVIYNQIIKPQLDLLEIENIKDNDLILLTQAFINKDKHTFEYLIHTDNLFKDFRLALITYKKKLSEKIISEIAPGFKIAQKTFSSFNAQYSSIISNPLKIPFDLANSMKAISSLSTPFLITEHNMQKIIQPLITQTSYAVKILEESFKPQIEFWQNWMDSHNPLLEKYWQYWKELEKNYKITEESALRILKKYKWFITPSLPTSFVFEVVEINKNKGRQDKAINSLFIDYFSAKNWHEISLLVRTWKEIPLFDNRIKIITDCVKILSNERGSKINIVNVILPTLIVQIDGLVSDYLRLKNISWDTAYDDFIRNGKVIKKGRKKLFETNRSSTIPSEFEELANDIFLNILFQTSSKGKPLKNLFNFNRHKILHGENLRYGRKDYLIRAFLVLDLFAYLE